MFSLIVEGAITVAVIGVVAKYILDWKKSEYRIDNTELAIALGTLLLVVVPLTAWVGTKIAINNQVSFKENWGGFETRADRKTTTCQRDGSCSHCYDCDPYTVRVAYECGGYTGSGKKRRYVSKTCHRNETRYHSCPYTTEEWTFTIDTTLDPYTIASHNLPTDPDEHRWRSGHRVPDSIPSGTPAFWQAARDRLDRGDPGPVTKRVEYDNYILASQSTILKRFSDSIARYKAASLLPPLNHNIHDFYWEDRAYFVGVSPPGSWQPAVNQLDAALGATLQGDLQLVIVDANQVTDPDNYQGALMAYWESPEFEKDALSKNGIVVVLGTVDGQTVKWARAFTGMPVGNEALIVDIQNTLPGTKLDPQSILGHPKAAVSGNGVTVSHPEPQGALERVLWGEHQFARVHMKSRGKGSVGYEYLLRELEPTGWQRFWILFVTVLFACIAWGICIAHGAPAYRSWRSSHYDY